MKKIEPCFFTIQVGEAGLMFYANGKRENIIESFRELMERDSETASLLVDVVVEYIIKNPKARQDVYKFMSEAILKQSMQ